MAVQPTALVPRWGLWQSVRRFNGELFEDFHWGWSESDRDRGPVRESDIT
jgi:hypothetical protein